MSKFEELAMPQGSLNHWYILTALGAADTKIENFWLKNNGTISNNVNNPQDFYYDTMLDALVAIESYYIKHNVPFPFHKELTTYRGRMGGLRIPDSLNNSSRKMDFI